MATLKRGWNDIIGPRDLATIVNPDGGVAVVNSVQSGAWNVGQVGVWTNKIAEPQLLIATGTFNSLGNNTIIAAPASGTQIKITAFQIQNESANETVATIKFGSTDKWRFLAKEKGLGFILPLAPGHILPVGLATALIVNLNVANIFGYNVAYYIE